MHCPSYNNGHSFTIFLYEGRLCADVFANEGCSLLFLDTFLVRSIMRQRQPTATSAKKVAALDVTHVLLQTNDGLLLGTTDQIEHGGQENLRTGFISTLVNGRKRTVGMVVCLGKYIVL